MERDVGFRVLVDVLGRCRRAELVELRAQRGDLGVGRVHGREARRHALERCPHLDHFDDLLLRLADDEHTAARLGSQEALLLEQRHRLPDRRARYPERVGELALVQADLGRLPVDVGVLDRLLERRVRLVANSRSRQLAQCQGMPTASLRSCSPCSLPSYKVSRARGLRSPPGAQAKGTDISHENIR
jgi:hypothetical protein